MSTRSIRFPASLDAKLRRAAARDGVSINQYVSLAVAERLATETALEALRQRARRSSRQKFLAALDAVPDAPPMRGDEIGARSRVRERPPTSYRAKRHKWGRGGRPSRPGSTTPRRRRATPATARPRTPDPPGTGQRSSAARAAAARR